MKKIIKEIINIFSFLINNIKKNSVHKTSNISILAIITKSKIGKYTYVGPFCIVKKARIGNYSSIAPSVSIGGMEHDYTAYSTSTFLSPISIDDEKETTIGDDVWIGTNTTIKQGVKIGDGAVIGANSLVLKDVEPYSIYIGSPARRLKLRFSQDKIAQIKNNPFYGLNPEQALKIIKDYNI